jgi:hypothetical protein
MVHRHLTHSDWTLAAVDAAISRGVRADWRELRLAAEKDAAVRERIQRVCAAKVSDPYAQRYHLWSRCE